MMTVQGPNNGLILVTVDLAAELMNVQPNSNRE